VTERLVLVLGGSRSGKSRFGLRRAAELANGRPVIYVATAEPGDPELDDRIRRHRLDRPPDWVTVDATHDLAHVIRALDRDTTLLVDGLTLWLSTITHHGQASDDIDAILDGPVADALDALCMRAGPAVVVSDELGLGMVPMSAVARSFRDLQGIAHQRIAAVADEVHFLVAGIPMTLRSR
jgi:adenosylcobinamide kinase / adenosylcobinamide-phosphate guanylyltransferase